MQHLSRTSFNYAPSSMPPSKPRQIICSTYVINLPRIQQNPLHEENPAATCVQRGNNNLSKPIRNHLNTYSLRMTRRRLCIFGWIADGEDRHKLIVRHLREKLLELRRIEMRDPRRPKSSIASIICVAAMLASTSAKFFLSKGRTQASSALLPTTKATGAPKMKDVVCETFSIASALSRSQI